VNPLVLAAVVATSLATAAFGATLTALARIPGRPLLVAAAVAWTATAVQSVVAGLGLLHGHRVPSTSTLVGYLVGILVVQPLAVAWAWAERTRWSGAVVAVGAVTVAVMTARIDQLWQGRG